VRVVEVVEAALVQALEHALLYGLPGHAQERSDKRRPERLLPRRVIRKVI
jgi:hypothetical protein